jgi:ribonucleoside-diphosphate reductase alpha chain
MATTPEHAAHRRRFPTDRARAGFIHKGTVAVQAGEIEFYITANFFEDDTLGEIFVKIAKQGSELAGWVNAWAVTVSIALQHGVTWDALRTKYVDQQFGGAVNAPSTLHAIAASVDDLIALRSRSISTIVDT